jgi:outer membrane receptor protein involved in Fe transport
MLLVLALGAAIAGVPAAAQETTAVAHGVVKDATGGVMPGVTVTARHLDTGRVRPVVTDAAGRFLLTQLPIGRYEFTAELSGFQTQVRRGIELAVGQDALLDFSLTVGGMSESVVVTQESPIVATTNASVSGVVSGQQIRELPLNGRDFMQLALLQAGVANLANSNTAPDKGTGIRASFAGARPYQTGFLLDGTDISTRSNFRTPGSAAGVALGVETVREFQVLVNSFSAEFGNAAGGVINAVSRSGANDLHGSGFEFARNSRFDAPNHFDRGDPPPFSRHQFGFTLGGPIAKNKLFYFGAFEGLRQTLAQTLIATVPTAAARLGNLPSGPVAVADVVKPYLSLWPLPNGRDFGDGTAEYVSSPSAPTRENYSMGRVDYNLSSQDSLFVRYSHDDATTLTYPSPVTNVGTDQSTHYRFVTVEATRILTSRTSNMARFAMNRTNSQTTDHWFNPIDKSLYFVKDAPTFGSFAFGSNFAQVLSNPGASGRNPTDGGMNLFQFADTMTAVRGAHAFKAGVNVNRYHLDDFNGPGDLGGQYQFASFAGLLTGRPSSLRITDPSASREHHFRQWLVGAFVQDDWKLRQNITLNLGVRYETVSAVKELGGQIATLPDYLHQTALTTGGPLFKNPSRLNFAPRLGFAWDVTGDGRTAVRAGAGVFHDELITNYLNQTSDSNPPFSLRADVRNPAFPDALSNIGNKNAPAPATLNIFDFNASRQPYLVQFNTSVQRALGATSAVTVGYVGSRGVNLQRAVLVNPPTPIVQADGSLFFPAGAPRLNPAFGNIFARKQDGSSVYHSLQVKLERRLSAGLQFQSSYTLAKSVDDTSTSHGATDFGLIQVVQHPYDVQFDRGLSNFDVRHNWVTNFNYAVPSVGRGTVHAVLTGWQVGGIYTMSSGSPFFPIIGFDIANLVPTNNATRPDLVAGFSSNPVRPGNPDQYFDPAAFALPKAGTFGNLPRNTLIGPGRITLDAVLSRRIAFGQRHLELRVEGFNLFNRANFSNPSAIVVFDAAGPVNSAGRITSTATTSRQIQFGVKFTF